VRRLGYRYQRTIARPAEVCGVGFLTGAMVRLRFQPAPPHTGVVFLRTDLGPGTPIGACVANVTGTQRRTSLGRPPNQVGLVEHVLAALAGLRIDNCIVQLDAPEPPGLDGSARGFVEILRKAEPVVQPARRGVWTASAVVQVAQNCATLTLYPGDDDLKISYLLDYGHPSPIGRQTHTEIISPESFANDLAGCRTFILEEETAELRRQGLGPRTTAADLLVFGQRGPVNNQVRYANEPARHKILDLVGDLALFGHDLRGHLVAYRSGHPLNVQLARELNLRVGNTGSAQEVAA
jgi:UDP-3-O-acyl N-acetylglucosamine deacetylase